MPNHTLLMSLLATCATLLACDGVYDEDVQEDTAGELAEERRLNSERTQVPPSAEENDRSEVEFTDAAEGIQGPPGQTCCVDCGDGWGGWYNLGTADDCNGRGKKFCEQNGWYFINGEWRTYC